MFNDNLRHYRKLKGMTQVQLSEALSVTKATVAMWETGAREPSISKLSRLADVLDCTTDELLGRTTGKPKASTEGKAETYIIEIRRVYK